MQINVVTVVPYPIEQVYAAMRDEMVRLGEYMPNIDAITIESREETAPGETRLVNRWQAARTEVPAVARPFVDHSKTWWIDRATWTEPQWRCDWDLEVAMMPDRIRCNGSTTYHALPNGHTEMRIVGTLEINLAGMIPKLLIKKATPAVEGFIVKMVQPNFQKTADALTKYLDAQRDQ